MTLYEKARAFLYRGARPLEMALFRWYFEGGSKDDVLHALSFYQNADGGFGHGVEADYLNPASTPIATQTAALILQQLHTPTEHPMVQGVLRYLDSGADFDPAHRQWRNTVPSNNDHPHATWWEWRGESEFSYNPTASLCAFMLRHAAATSPLRAHAEAIAREAVTWFMANEPFDEQHVTVCFLHLREGLLDAGLPVPEDFEAALHRQVKRSVCPDVSVWATQYVCYPSNLISGPQDPFFADIADAAYAECDFLHHQQQPDGSWPVTWQWWTPYKEFEVSANWWRGHIILKNLLYLRCFGKLDK